MIYRSSMLDRVWGLGYASVGDVTFGSAAYVARYHVKKVGGVVSDDHYVNPVTGECLRPEYVTMSRRPGIGRGWFDKFSGDVYPRDSRVIKGLDTKPCRFYDSLYERSEPESYRRIKLVRARAVDLKDNSELRLAVKETVKLAQVSSLSSSVLGDK